MSNKAKKNKVLFFVICLLLSSCSRIRNIEFTSHDDTVTIGDEINLAYITSPNNADREDITVLFDNEILVENKDNETLAKAEGNVEISIYYKDKIFDTKKVEILPIYCTDLFIENYLIGLGRSEKIKVQYYPDDCTHKEYSLKSDNEEIVKTFGDKIIAVSEGETNIHAYSIDGAETEFLVSVYPIRPSSISIKTSESKLMIGAKRNISILYVPEDTTDKNIGFYSSNSYIASVDENGTITANNPGDVTITAIYSDDVYDEINLTVTYPPVSSISMTTNVDTIYPGDLLRTYISFSPEKVDDYTIEYTSSNEKVATVNSNGTITGIGIGTATITAKSINGKNDSIKVSVVEKPVVTYTRSNNSYSESSSSSSGGGGMVWIPRTGSKYHSRSSCSNMKNPSEVTLEYAQAHGYTACKKCY